MSSPSAREHLGTFARFSASGVVNTLIGYAVIFALMAIGLNPYVSNACGYGIGFAVAFLLHKEWVFRARNVSDGVRARYVVSVAAAYLLNLVVLRGALGAGLWGWVAQVSAGLVYTLVLYVVSSFWVFRDQRTECV